MTTESVLIVGAGLAAARCAETLRAEGFAGQIVVAGDEAGGPYERPALSKDLLTGARASQHLGLPGVERWEERGIVLVAGDGVVAIDAERRTARTAAGCEMPWDRLVIATGACPRSVPGLSGRPGVHHLRSLPDAVALREALGRGMRLAVIGGGLIGAEVASSVIELGGDVAIVESLATPLERAVGGAMGAMIAERWRSHGVDLRLGARVAGLVPGDDGRPARLRLEGEPDIACDVVLVSVGTRPTIALAAAMGLDIAADGGVMVDRVGRTSLPDVYACGDVASPWRAARGGHVRVEHWLAAATQGASVARAILDLPERPDPVPYFWSDQFGLRLQGVGDITGWATVEMEGTPDAFVARYHSSGGDLLGALAGNRPDAVGALRREFTDAPVGSGPALSV